MNHRYLKTNKRDAALIYRNLKRERKKTPFSRKQLLLAGSLSEKNS